MANTDRTPRAIWATLTDDQLIAQCDIDTYRASGPGGQKRNKTSSAVRFRHRPSGLIVIAEESRSQHENKAKCVKRLRKAFYLEWRDQLPQDQLTPEALGAEPMIAQAKATDGKFHLNAKNDFFWPLAGIILDLLLAVEARVSDAATLLGTSTGNLIDVLQTDPKLWQTANQLRQQFGQKPLR